MAPTMLRRAIAALKDQTIIGLAKLNHPTTLLSDLEIAIVKATKHDEYPANEKHIDIILNLTCYSRPYVCTCVKTISRRLRKTRNWVVALKSLMLIHRLLQDGDASFENEFFLAIRHGTRLLNMSDFMDKSCQDSWDCSIFVRKYALYLNNQLRHMMQAKKGKHGCFVSTSWGERKEKVKRGTIVVSAAPFQDMKIEHIFKRIHSLMQNLELFLSCRPTGSSKTNRLVKVALYSVIKESFILYYNITEIMDVLMKRFMELNIQESLMVYEILYRTSKQFDELHAFYNWSISIGIGRCSEYPEVVKIPQIKLDVMEAYIREKTMIELDPEPPVEEQNMNSIKALPPPEGLPEKTEEVDVKIHEVGDLINLDDDDPPTTEEHPDRLALTLIDDYASTSAPTTEPSPWESFVDLDDWETELEQSANNIYNQKETPAWGFVTMMPDYAMHQQGVVNHKVVIDSTIGVPAMLALAPPPLQNVVVNTNMGYPYYAGPTNVQMPEMDIKQRLPLEQQVMWQQYARDGMQEQVAYAMIQPHAYAYNQGGYMYNQGGYMYNQGGYTMTY
ncbi:hypothetical protein Leryth_002117 [Lithospermum erythrorhizon]|nr:hypothetical protein Leryth_002117 [Lithospermum erythrorhizon]